VISDASILKFCTILFLGQSFSGSLGKKRYISGESLGPQVSFLTIREICGYCLHATLLDCVAP